MDYDGSYTDLIALSVGYVETFEDCFEILKKDFADHKKDRDSCMLHFEEGNYSIGLTFPALVCKSTQR